MADVITRFKLETTQYDSKLRDASKELAEYTRLASMAGNEFGKFTQKNVEAARAFGQIATSATNSKDKVKELVSAFNEVAKQYNVLTKEQQQSDFGKALSESMTTLKRRISDAKQEMNSTGGVMEQLASKFTINIDALKLFEWGLKAANVALGVAKDAFFASEATVDEWGRTVAASQSLYEGFLTAINNGDISGYLSNIDSIVKAARLAYDELDKLGTMKTIQAPQISKQQTENERIRSMIQTGRYIAPQDGRRNAVVNGREMKTGDKLTAEQIRALEKHLQGGMQKMVKLVGNEVEQTGKAINAYYDKLAKTNGTSLQEFKKGTSSWEEFSKRMQGYEQYKEWDKQARTEFAKQGGRGYVDFDKSNPFAEFRKWGTFRVDKDGDNSYKNLVALIQQRDQQVGQVYSTQAQAYRAMNRAEGVTVRQIMGSSGGGGTSGGKGGKTEIEAAIGSIDEQTKKVQELQKAWRAAADDDSREKIKKEIEEQQYVLDRMTGKEKFDPSKMTALQGVSVAKRPELQLNIPDISKQKQEIQLELKAEAVKVDETTLHNLMKDAIQNGINGMDFNFAILGEKIGRGIDVPQSAWEGIMEQYNALREQIGLEPIKIDFKTGEVKNQAKEMTKDWNSAASAIQSVGQAMSQIEDPAAKVMGTIAQAIATIALTFAKSLEKTFTPWDWIAAAAAGTATMISTISAIHSATGYAQGGVIKGNSYSGDNIGGIVDGGAGGFVGLNAGEVVLNQAQTANVANALEGSGMKGIDLSASVSGEQILLVANRTTRRQGLGELVTWK